MIHPIKTGVSGLGYCLMRTLIMRQSTGSSALFLIFSWSGKTGQQRVEKGKGTTSTDVSDCEAERSDETFRARPEYGGEVDHQV